MLPKLRSMYLSLRFLVYSQWIRTWDSDWIFPSPHRHKRSSWGILAHLPVSIFSLCELNLSLVVSTLYVSHTPEWYMGCNESIGFSALYTTDLDESEFVTGSLMIFETSLTGVFLEINTAEIFTGEHVFSWLCVFWELSLNTIEHFVWSNGNYSKV